MAAKDVNVELLDRKKSIEKETSALQEEAISLIEEGKLMNQRIAEIRTRQIQLQGEIKVCNDLLEEDEK